MQLYTIGFTQKTAEDFFARLRAHGVQRLVDIRLNPHGQLAGFAKQEDLPYFLNALAGGCQYTCLPLLAPTKAILKDYRGSGDWSTYVSRFEALMDERNVPAALDRGLFEGEVCCLLCSEAEPDQCHRRLVAERLAAHWPNVAISHL
ncbi:MAG: DUF488 domain-containing protein [Anaerolineales bacterium]|nr:DUF488 domain-containing protein [Anaerolineales bacterium]